MTNKNEIDEEANFDDVKKMYKSFQKRIDNIRAWFDDHAVIREIIITLCIMAFFLVGQADGRRDGIAMGQILCNDFVIEEFYPDRCTHDDKGNYVCDEPLNLGNNSNMYIDYSEVINENKYQERKEKFN